MGPGVTLVSGRMGPLALALVGGSWLDAGACSGAGGRSASSPPGPAGVRPCATSAWGQGREHSLLSRSAWQCERWHYCSCQMHPKYQSKIPCMLLPALHLHLHLAVVPCLTALPAAASAQRAAPEGRHVGAATAARLSRLGRAVCCCTLLLQVFDPLHNTLS